MAKPLLFYTLSCLCFLLTCSATLYTVGDSAGWDISSSLDSWTIDKTFKVGDVLLFQYSSYHNVVELTKDNFDGCNVGNPLQISSNGNTSIPLTSPGQRYFACGNKLHCLGGMKLQVNVVGDQAVSSPAGAPQASAGSEPETPSSLPPPSSKTNSIPIPTSTGFVHGGKHSLIIACLSFLGTLSVSI
ncbi:PREDICTED: stellacyanin-like [Nelumbo nucifera]|uniref:Stellacyanin-like n=2 Tax=Nelumbo nucifera TaxID=4432 RepID=A0A1U7ZY38_NELNU|nr:PREDICTED: stellacyanin-like [Nelumbo nucifera]DAD47663.1 TPA_asm: hypothetical protein HUJ06_017600 [Nelumbo nucifera]